MVRNLAKIGGDRMLVLARKVGQSIVISDNITVSIIEIRDGQVRLGIEAPKSTPVHRKELLDQIRAGNTKASPFDDGES